MGCVGEISRNDDVLSSSLESAGEEEDSCLVLSFGIPLPHSTQCVRDFKILKFYLLVSHNIDTPIYVFPLAYSLSVSINNNNNSQKIFERSVTRM